MANNFGVEKLRGWSYGMGGGLKLQLVSPIERAGHPYSSATPPRSL